MMGAYVTAIWRCLPRALRIAPGGGSVPAAETACGGLGVLFYGRKEIKDSSLSLRLVACIIRMTLLHARGVNVPKRNLGQRRMAFLKDYAEVHACSLFQALEQTIEDEIFKRTKAKQLVALVRKFRGLFEGRPVSEVLAALINESGYEQCRNKVAVSEGAAGSPPF